MPKQKMKTDVERALSWAYREELPKKELGISDMPSSYNAVDRYIDNGGRQIDHDPWELHLRSQRYAGIGKPHVDARDLACLVDGLDDVIIQWPAAKQILLPDLAPYVTKKDEFIVRKLRQHSGSLVRAHARMGTRPMWDIWWRFEPVLLANNRPLTQYVNRQGNLSDCTKGERDYTRFGQCPIAIGVGARPGEYNRMRRDMTATTPLVEIVSARFDYFVWHAALREIVRQTMGSWKLEDHELTGPAAPQTPWAISERKPRILPALQETGNQERVSRVTEVVGS